MGLRCVCFDVPLVTTLERQRTRRWQIVTMCENLRFPTLDGYSELVAVTAD